MSTSEWERDQCKSSKEFNQKQEFFQEILWILAHIATQPKWRSVCSRSPVVVLPLFSARRRLPSARLVRVMPYRRFFYAGLI